MYLDGPVSELNETDVETWDEIMRFIAERKYNMVVIDCGDGIKYDSHPEISAPDAWDKDFLKKKLAEIRALGMEPIPKLNFSCCHHTWLKEYRRMVSTPVYYNVCADLIREVCDLFDGPEFFHLGLEEEEYAIGFRKNDQKLRDEVQKILGEMKADGTLGEISTEWFGSDITTVK
jgi:hypothetical protein